MFFTGSALVSVFGKEKAEKGVTQEWQGYVLNIVSIFLYAIFEVAFYKMLKKQGNKSSLKLVTQDDYEYEYIGYDSEETDIETTQGSNWNVLFSSFLFLFFFHFFHFHSFLSFDYLSIND